MLSHLAAHCVCISVVFKKIHAKVWKIMQHAVLKLILELFLGTSHQHREGVINTNIGTGHG